MKASENDFVITIFTIFTLIFTANLCAQNSFDYVTRGDQFAKTFDNQRALVEYKKAYKADTSNCTALWKIAEAHINLGEEAEKPIQIQYYYVAEKWARKAVTLCPDTANSHFFVAVSAGVLAPYEGGKRKINRSRTVKEEAEKTLALDPQHHGAYHVLGRWHRELANLNWFLKTMAKIVYGGVPTGASLEAAVHNFKRAIEIKPDWINHHKQLGLTYMAMHRWELARKEFKTAIKLPVQDHQDPSHKEKCQKLLQKIKRKISPE